jgi:glycosyltransferase involved in cell wall biosynthesis
MWQHLSSFSRRVQERACPVRLLIHPGFGWMNDDWSPVTNYSFSSQGMGSATRKALAFLWLSPFKLQRLFRNHPPAAILLVSWHPLNFLVARLAKCMYPDIPVITWLHEPYKDEKGIYGAKALIIWLVELCQTLSLRYTDVAILHSRRGVRLFEKRYPDFSGTRRVIPLHFQDDGIDAGVERRYVSFLGRADKAKGIALFFELVETLAPRNAGYEFQIVTSSDIQPYLKGLSPAARSRLRVVNKSHLSDKELRAGATNSLAVLSLYKETMQSGIIPVAMMKGTPVIGTDIEGISEWIRDRETGVIVPRDPSTADIEAAISFIKKKLSAMSPLCRDYFLATFDDSNWDRDYGWLREFIPRGTGSMTSS